MTTAQLEEMRDAAVKELHERKSALEESEKRIADAGDDADLDALRAEFDERAGAFDEQADEVERTKRNLADAERRAKVLDDNPEPVRRAANPKEPVTERDLVYSAQNPTFVRDAWAMKSSGDTDARERLERHGKVQMEIHRALAAEKGYQFRDVGTGAFAGLTVPQYLIDLFAPLARAGAPLLASIPRKMQAPASGTQIVISRLTTGTAVAAISSENAAVQETDADDTTLTVNLGTYAGQQDVSRVAVERSEMVDTVVFQDLFSDYFTKIDAALISGSGSGFNHLGIVNVGSIITKTYTDGTPTLPELYPKVADAIQAMASQLYRPATTIFMHPRRWGWATAALDSSSRPLVVPDAQGPFNALAVGDAPEYGAVVGTMQGLPVITDANITTTNGAGTNEDQILVERMPELLWWQEGDGTPRQFSFEQSNAPQSIRLAVWGYSFFTAARYPVGNAVISGTGLVTPTF